MIDGRACKLQRPRWKEGKGCHVRRKKERNPLFSSFSPAVSGEGWVIEESLHKFLVLRTAKVGRRRRKRRRRRKGEARRTDEGEKWQCVVEKEEKEGGNVELSNFHCRKEEKGRPSACAFLKKTNIQIFCSLERYMGNRESVSYRFGTLARCSPCSLSRGTGSSRPRSGCGRR